MNAQLFEALEAVGIDPSQFESLAGSGDAVLVTSCPGSTALDVWRQLRSAVGRTHHWPALFGPKGEFISPFGEDTLVGDDDPLVTISKAASLDVAEFFNFRLTEMVEAGELPRGAWPGESHASTAEDLTIHKDILSMKPSTSVLLGLIATQEPWKLPALLRFGGWNDCPIPEAHLAVQQYWHEEYGSEIVGIARDTVECLVQRPPTTQEDAIELAMQQYAYAPDIVDQGTETIDNLASTLLRGEAWYFWWD